MKWEIGYSKRANDFSLEHGARDKINAVVKDFILKITGANINIDVKKLKGEWAGYYRVRKGNIRVIIKPNTVTGTIFVDTVDFRGNVYK